MRDSPAVVRRLWGVHGPCGGRLYTVILNFSTGLVCLESSPSNDIFRCLIAILTRTHPLSSVLLAWQLRPVPGLLELQRSSLFELTMNQQVGTRAVMRFLLLVVRLLMNVQM